MADISTVWSSTGTSGDWVLTSNGADLQGGDDVVTGVLISLFTDRLANIDDTIPDGTTDPRGWIGDLGQEYLIGSRLWLLSRAKLTLATGPLAAGYAKEALQWMLDDGVVAKFDITTQVLLPKQLNMQVIAYKQDGTKIPMNFTNAWAGV